MVGLQRQRLQRNALADPVTVRETVSLLHAQREAPAPKRADALSEPSSSKLRAVAVVKLEVKSRTIGPGGGETEGREGQRGYICD